MRAPRLGLALGALATSALLLAAPDVPAAEARDQPEGAYLSSSQSARTPRFWWPTLVLERSSRHLRGARSLDETRLGLGLAHRSASLSPHLRALLSPSLDAYQNLAASVALGLRVHFELAGIPLSYGVAASLEARLRDSLWLAYATPLEIGAALHRGASAEHYVFVGARRSMAGALINSFLLDPNGYDNESSLERLAGLREERPWQLYVTFAFGRRVE